MSFFWNFLKKDFVVERRKLMLCHIPTLNWEVTITSWLSIREFEIIFSSFCTKWQALLTWPNKVESNFKVGNFPQETNIELHIGDFLCMDRRQRGPPLLEDWIFNIGKQSFENVKSRPNDACNKKWPTHRQTDRDRNQLKRLNF